MAEPCDKDFPEGTVDMLRTYIADGKAFNIKELHHKMIFGTTDVTVTFSLN